MEGVTPRLPGPVLAWIALSFFCAAATSSYSFQPRMVVQNGHLEIVSAEGRNITIRTSIGGFVNLNGENLVQLVAQAKAATRIVETLGVENSATYLETTLSSHQEFSQRLNALERITANFTSRNWRPSQDTQSFSNRRLRGIIRRVSRLESFMNEFQRLIVINECNSSPCQNGGTCMDLYNDILCLCTPNWQGKFCNIDANECTQFSGTELGCQNGATCVNTPGSYQCQCTPGWYGVHCTLKSDNCSSGSIQELCGNGICVPQSTSLGYTCLCNAGWTKGNGGTTCTVDVNECSAYTPACSHDPPVPCINTPGSFTCGSCPQGYSGNGYYCSDINECLINNGGCSMSPYVPCINTRGSRTCGSCPPGFQGDGTTCTRRGVCEINNGGCHPMARCFENPRISQSYVECICLSGYTGNGLGPAGCRPISSGGGATVLGDPCSARPCQNGGTCIATTPSSMSCLCLPGFHGLHCESRVDPCQSNPCQNEGICVASNNTTGFSCLCPRDYTGEYCQTLQQACGGTLKGLTGMLRFPPVGTESYPHSINCAWLLLTNRTQVLTITFTKFHLEESPSCQYDWLQIHDGRGAGDHMIGRFCGPNLPKGGSIISTRNSLYLWFRSDHSVSNEGFEVTWNSINPVCGGRIETNSHGSVQSPGSPGKYPINRDCYWQLTVPVGNRIQLNFFTLQIEAHPNCSYDFLEVRDGLEPTSPLLNKYCNSTLPAPIVTSGSAALLYFHSDESASDYGFQITFSKVAGTPGCGGMHTRPSGEITTPNSPNDYTHNMNCQWVIRVPLEERVKIIFTSFNVEDSRGCRFDYVEIRDGNDETSPLLSRLCGNNIPRPFVSSGNTLMIQFTTDSSVSGKGFHLRYETACGGSFSELSGIIHSPYYPNPYPENRECVYHIALPPQNAIKLTFQDLEIEESNRCLFDHIEVRDGDYENATIIGKYCGGVHNLPSVIISSLNHLWIQFKTDASVAKRGFLANYTAIPLECGGIMTQQPSGVISSPTHPDQYPPNLDCVWVIRGLPGQVVQLTWQTFALEDHESCNMDHIQVYDNSSISGGVLMGQYCGSALPPVLRTIENVMTIIFHSDYSISHDGFSAQYTFIDGSTICGGTYFTTLGVLTSPGYPNSYSPNKDCTWIIHVPSGQQIKLNVTEFELESSSPCAYDYLEIRNGGQVTSPLIGKYCGARINSQITSMGNQLFLRFVTDSSVSAKGFKITWDGTSTGCGGTLTSATGSIQSPNYPHPYGRNAECVWKISISQGSKISVIFADLDLEEESSCRYDNVEIRDGPDGRGKVLGIYCKDHPLPLMSSTNQLWVKFRSDSSNQGRGFNLRYATDCNVELTGLRGVLESPNFPDPYPSLHECLWTITAPKGNLLNITFSHFLLENSSSSGCEYDFIEIKEGPATEEGRYSLIGKYCGTDLPPRISSTMPRVKIHMKTDVSVAHNGFRLEWVVNGCGGFLTKHTGRFTSPGYPSGYPVSTSCIWHIKVPWGHSIEITVENVEIERSPRCSYDSLQIYGGPDMKSPKLLNTCHFLNTSMVVTTSGNNALVVFDSDYSYGGKGFSIAYRSVLSACGGNFTAPFGTIHSRNYPQNYESRDECFWLIKVDKSHRIRFEFMEFDVEGYGNCSSDYVNVFDGKTESDRMLLHHCGSSLPNPPLFYSTGNSLLIRMRTDSSIAAKGFLANYTIACGARILVTSEGELEASTALEHNNTYNNSCTWLLEAEKPGDQITFTIARLQDGAVEDPEMNCMLDYLEVHDGRDANSPLIDKYCGSALPHHITSTGSALYVNYAYSFIHSISPFKAFYSVLKTACGGELIAEHGAFASPGIPGSYPSSAECVWTINTSPGNKAMLSFRSFDVEESNECDKDYVEIRQGSSVGNLIGVYCGNSIPDNITASSMFWIKFRSDENGTGQGFVADYSMLHGNELSGDRGQIASPLYPYPFTASGVYTWRITVQHGMTVSLTFEDFYVDSFHSSCLYSLKILDGYDESAPVLFEDCGYNKPPPLTSSSNVVYIVWNIEHIRMGSWFLLNWLRVPRVISPAHSSTNTSMTSPGCGGIFTATMNATVFTSPGYPNGYAKNLDCEWIFETTPYNHIKILVNEMNLVSTPYCSVGDNLKLYNGKEGHQEWELLKTYCLHNSSREDPVKGSNIMKAVFHTDAFTNGTGFSALAVADCGGSLQGPNGIIDALSLNRTTFSGFMWIECAWDITVKTGRTIVVEFDEYDIPTLDTHCDDSYVLFRNGGTASSPYLGNGKYCGTRAPSLPETVGNHMYIKYSAVSGTKGFKLRYREKSLSCGGHMALSTDTSSFQISSPNYPNIPPPHIECSWVFLAPAGEGIDLDFIERFDLTPSRRCTEAYVEVRDGGTENGELLGTYCTSKPGTVSSTGNIMYIKYFTDVDEPRNGFKANVSIAKCGGTLRSYSGTVLSPHYPATYPSNSKCKWTIETSSYSTVTITFTHLDLPKTHNCSSTDHILITEKGYRFQNELQATSTRSPNPLSTTDRFETYEYEEYDEEEENEPNQINSAVEERRSILAVICGSDLPPPIQSSSNEVEIKFVSRRATEDNKGFRLEYVTSSSTCGSTLEGLPSGILESPGYPNGITTRRICVWRIRVPKGRRIRFDFQDLDLAGNSINCIHKVAIFNGEGFINVIKAFCAGSSPQSVETSSNVASVYYWAKLPSNHRGFRATYSSDLPSICEGDLSSSSGIITSPRVALNDTFYCEWERQNNASSDSTLSLTILNSQIGEAGAGFCRYYPSAVLISNGDSVTLDELCGNYSTPRIVTNPYPKTKIVARQGWKKQYRGGVNNFTLQYSVSRCGGVLAGPNEVITSPNFPGEYPSNVDCTWALNFPEGHQIKITYVNISLENSCSKDYVQIRNGGLPNSPLIGWHCGTTIPNSIQSQSNQLWVTFHSNNMIQASGFKMVAEAVTGGCGGNVHGSSGEIKTPFYPQQYENNLECLWEITVEPGYRVGLNFVERFQLEGSGSCSQDFVEIFNFGNDTWQSMGKLCGREPRGPFNSTGNLMRVLFRSNNSTRGDGFKAQWQVNCGGVINEKRGVVTSPGYPGRYGDHLVCEYVINSQNEYIIAEFKDFKLEKESTCQYDNLTIYAMESRGQSIRQFGPYCGTDRPPMIRAFGSIRLVFETDPLVRDIGFLMKFRVETCGGFMSSPGLITSPSQDNVYYGGLNCTWIIEAPTNQVVVLVFQSFTLERSGTCLYDHVSVYDAAYIDLGKRLARFCGNMTDEPPVIRSTGSKMTVQFSTDSSVHLEGFKAAVSFSYGESSGCGGVKNLPRDGSLRLSSPRITQNNHYEPFLDCHWLLIGHPQQMLSVEFKEMDLIACPTGAKSLCGCDFLEIRDGAGPFADLIGQYCGSSIPPTITSSSNQLWVRFVTDGFGNGQGFQLEIKSVNSPCGSELVFRVTNQTQVLRSPGYPNNYPNNLRCHWLLMTEDQGFRFDIHFKDMDIEDSQDCDNDWLEIYDTAFSGVISEGYGENFVHRGKIDFEHRYNMVSLRLPWQRSKFCGVGHPSDFYSGTNQVDIKFMTNSANTSRGFELEFRFEGCNRNFTRDQGRIMNSKVSLQENCLITIQAKPNHTISLYFNDFRMITHEDGSPSMEIRDGLSASSPILSQIEGHAVPDPVFSTSSAVSIRIRSSPQWSSESFDITYVTTDKGRGCGGRLFNYGGRFTSPLYPMNVRNETNCRWEVTVPVGSIVALRFLTFDLGSRNSCETDYVNVYDVDKLTNGEILRSKFCGVDDPAPLLAASNTVIVHSVTSFNNAGSGWVLAFVAARPGAVPP